VLIERDDPTPNEPSRRSVNVDYAAQLLLQGPFSGEVPSPLAFESMNSRGTPDDPGAVEQVEIRFRISGDSQALASAYLQLYRTPAGAQAASLARFKRYTVQYAEFGEIQGDPEAFWLFANGGLLAGGTSGHIFCEAVAVPDSNAMVGVTNGVVAACLDYGEGAIRLATSD
jgi:hypothetical protein